MSFSFLLLAVGSRNLSQADKKQLFLSSANSQKYKVKIRETKFKKN